MKSFNDWLDDNVAATREKLATKDTGGIALNSAAHPDASWSTIAPVPAGWVETVPRPHVLFEIRPGVDGPFPIGSYVVKKRPGNICAPAARPGVVARVLGYNDVQHPTELYIVLQWSGDPRSNGQMDGCYGTDGLEQA